MQKYNVIGKSSKVCRTAEYLDLQSKASNSDLPKSKIQKLLSNRHLAKEQVTENYLILTFDGINYAIPKKYLKVTIGQ